LTLEVNSLKEIIINTNKERGQMARIRLNQEYRNKVANRIKQSLFQEDTQEKRKY